MASIDLSEYYTDEKSKYVLDGAKSMADLENKILSGAIVTSTDFSRRAIFSLRNKKLKRFKNKGR